MTFITVRPVDSSTPLLDVAKEMLETGHTIIPVCNKGSYLGVVTERDIITAIVRADYDLDLLTANSVMSFLPVILASDDFWQAANLMVETGCQTLVVLDEGMLFGLFTLENLAREQPPLAGIVFSNIIKCARVNREHHLAYS